MGNIKVIGEASGMLVMDKVVYQFDFYAESIKLNIALQQVKSQIKAFINEVKQIGLEASSFHMDQDKIDKTYHEDKYTVIRKIKLYTKYDSKLSQYFLEIIEKKRLDIKFEAYYSASHINEFYLDLRQKAIENAKEKADAMASILKQKVIGIESIKDEDYYDYDDENDWKESIHTKPKMICGLREESSDFDFSNPQAKKTFKLLVTWMVEKKMESIV